MYLSIRCDTNHHCDQRSPHPMLWNKYIKYAHIFISLAYLGAYAHTVTPSCILRKDLVHQCENSNGFKRRFLPLFSLVNFHPIRTGWTVTHDHLNNVRRYLHYYRICIFKFEFESFKEHARNCFQKHSFWHFLNA